MHPSKINAGQCVKSRCNGESPRRLGSVRWGNYSRTFCLGGTTHSKSQRREEVLERSLGFRGAYVGRGPDAGPQASSFRSGSYSWLLTSILTIMTETMTETMDQGMGKGFLTTTTTERLIQAPLESQSTAYLLATDLALRHDPRT